MNNNSEICQMYFIDIWKIIATLPDSYYYLKSKPLQIQIIALHYNVKQLWGNSLFLELMCLEVLLFEITDGMLSTIHLKTTHRIIPKT